MKVAVVLLAVLMVGCKASGDKVTTDSLAAVKNGIYQKCTSEDGESIKEMVYITDTYIQERYVLYTDVNCQSGDEYHEEKAIYSYQNLGSNNFKLRLESAIALPIHPGWVSLLNTHSICGVSNWTADVPKSTIGLVCDTDHGANEIGDEGTLKAGMVGTSLRVVSPAGTTTYATMNAMNFSNTAQSLQNSNYAYYDGSNGMYLNIAGGNFTATVYDRATKKYFTIEGTLSGPGNTRIFTVDSTTPACPVNDIVYTFSQLTGSLALREDGESDLLLQELPYSNNLYVSSYLESGYMSGCF